MYELPNGLKVTGNHPIIFNDTFIRVDNHPDAINLGYVLPIVYNLITSTHNIPIGNYIFCDGN